MVRIKQMKAPYVSKGYMGRFLKLVKRVRLTEINASILRQNEVASPGNEHKMMAALRFLCIITPDGEIVKENLNKLRLEGDSYKQALQEIIKSAYKDLFNTIEITKATIADLKNYFVTKYEHSLQQARMATFLFLFLCEEAEIPLSEELSSLNKIKPRLVIKKIKKIDSIKEPSNSRSMPEKGYLVSIVGKNFSMSRVIKNKEDYDELIKTFEINFKLEEK